MWVVRMTTRTNQRARTRQALMDAAAALLDSGRSTPTMDEIAERARVSRATAYRYFDSAPDVVWQVVVDRQLEPVETAFVAAGDDVGERVERAEVIVNDYLFGDPDGARAFERAMLDRQLTGAAAPDDRAGRRLTYIDAALTPIAEGLDQADLERLRYALALTMGSQVVSALLDTCGLDIDQARDVTRFAARAIVADTLRSAGLVHTSSRSDT
jgi:AcrR family transcriptional regulator